MAKVEPLSQKEFAKRLGISTRAVRDLHAHGIPRRKDGKYPWPEARHWYIRFKQDERERRQGGGEDLDLRREMARKTAAQADEAELRLAERRREMIHIRDIERLVREPLEQVDAGLRNASSRHAAELAELAGISIAKAMHFLEQVMERIRTDLREIRHDRDRVA